MATPLLRLGRKIASLGKDQRSVRRYSNIIATRKVVAYLKKHFDENNIPDVCVEITNECNYACPFCPQSTFKRKPEYMTMEKFIYLVGELKKIKFDKSIILYVNNEPFMHPDLMDFCKIVTREIPAARIILESNGSLIMEGHLQSLLLLSNPVALTINDYTQDGRIASRIKRWHEGLKRKNNILLRTRHRCVSDKLSNRAGNQPEPSAHPEDYRDIACTWPFITLFLDSTLRSFQCCSDYKHEIIMGDLNKETLMEIWKSEKYRKVRENILSSGRMDNQLCRKCDAEWFCLPKNE
jgi:radical SAM protein with 4Fe4S-binding SPASM domain